MKIRPLSVASLLLILAAPAFADTFGTGGNQFTIDFVTIGNPKNPVRTVCDVSVPIGGPYCPVPLFGGSVPYVYRIGKYEISRQMIEKANADGNLGLTLNAMIFVKGGARPDMPATGLAWYQAARFVNYLNTSQGYLPAYKFATQPGDAGYLADYNIKLWEPSDPGYDATNRFRNRLAHYFLPNTNEWAKSAYYDPTANGGAGGYWNFATGSNSVPTAVKSGTAPGTAIWDLDYELGPADVMQAGGLSPYGTMGQSGNVWEWEETEGDSINNNSSAPRGVRGGHWSSNYYASYYMSAAFREQNHGPGYGDNYIGFRVASIPEPSSAYLAALSAVGLLLRRRRMRRA